MVTGRLAGSTWTAPLAVGIVALALILPTVMPGVGFWDTGEFQTVGPVLGTAHPTGFPSYVVLGWLASVVLQPIGDPAFRMNVLSALLVAAATGLAVILVRRLTVSTPVAVAAGVGLAITPIAWGIGTRADAHAFHLALVALLFICLVGWEKRHRGGVAADRWLIVAAAVYGVAAANHSLTLLLAPAIAVYVIAVDPSIWRRPRLVATCAVALVATLTLFYLELPLRAGPFRAPLVYGRPETWEGFRYVVLAEQFRGSLVDPFGDLGRKFAELVDLTAAQFGPLAPLVPVGFLATARREPRYAVLTGIGLAVTVFFAASYVNADISRYYLGPALVAWTWLAVLAATAVDQVSGPAGDRRIAAAVLAAALLLVPSLAALPERHREADRSRDTAAARWLDEAVAALEPGAVVVSWWSYSTPLWYAQHVEGRLPGAFIVDDRTRLDLELGEVTDVIDRHLGSRPVYVLRSNAGEMERLGRRYVLEPTGAAQPLHRVVARREEGG